MVRLRRTSADQPGWTRRRAGKGWTYWDGAGIRLEGVDALRCKQLVIPPAWTEVWICPHPNGHLQAVGTDAAGRRQYLYHEAWRERRDADKFVRVAQIAARLPAARRQVRQQLGADEVTKERALATAFGLLDLGLFRIGGEDYAVEHGSVGLATLRREHVHVDGTSVCFEYTGKSGVDHAVVVRDKAVVAAVTQLRRRRGGGDELLAYKRDGRWRDLTSDDINTHLKVLMGDDVSAKDFRTWHGTVLAAVALAERVDDAATKTARQRAVREAIKTVALDLGNTPAVARRSYVDPVVIDRFDDGVTIAPALRRIGPRVGHERRRQATERAVLRLLATR